MNAIPFELGMMHFVGIGGIGMSGIAEILHNLGYKVQGSDMSESANVQRLRGLGIQVSIGHDGSNLGEARSWSSPRRSSATTPRSGGAASVTSSRSCAAPKCWAN